MSLTTPNFGTNVLIFDPTMTNIQSQLNAVFAQQQYNQFGTQRNALLFKPGSYTNLDVDWVFTPRCWVWDNRLTTSPLAAICIPMEFCRMKTRPRISGEALKIWLSSQPMAIPLSGLSPRAPPSAACMSRASVDLADFTDENYASGGFMADSAVDATISSISQQQWLSRNDIWGSWDGGVWNMVFVGVSNPPAGTWPSSVYTVITNTPLIREKPYLSLDSNGNYIVMVPALETNSLGTTWAAGPTPGVSIPLSQFYMASAAMDNAATINAALNAGLNLILTPGVYQLTGSLQVTRPDTVIMGLGYATLVPQTGTPAMVISDVDGVKVAGLIFDAGPVQSTVLLQVGNTNSSLNHSIRPDLFV